MMNISLERAMKGKFLFIDTSALSNESKLFSMSRVEACWSETVVAAVYHLQEEN